MVSQHLGRPLRWHSLEPNTALVEAEAVRGVPSRTRSFSHHVGVRRRSDSIGGQGGRGVVFVGKQAAKRPRRKQSLDLCLLCARHGMGRVRSRMTCLHAENGKKQIHLTLSTCNPAYSLNTCQIFNNKDGASFIMHQTKMQLRIADFPLSF